MARTVSITCKCDQSLILEVDKYLRFKLCGKEVTSHSIRGIRAGEEHHDKAGRPYSPDITALKVQSRRQCHCLRVDSNVLIEDKEIPFFDYQGVSCKPQDFRHPTVIASKLASS